MKAQQPDVPAGNPFKPTFGVLPPHLAGRDDILRSINEAMAAGSGDPGFTSLMLGNRGTGKTALLLRASADLQESGWKVCRIDALAPGADRPISEAITQSALRLLADYKKVKLRPNQLSVEANLLGLVGGSATWDASSGDQKPLPRAMQHTLQVLVSAVQAKKGNGVLLFVDEFHNVGSKEASIIASAIQNAKSDGWPLGFIGAGLPHIEDTLMPNKGFTFFQRCAKIRMDVLDQPSTIRALRIPLEDSNIQISEDLLRRAALATNGHPYSIQMLGYHLWRKAHRVQQVNDQALHDSIRMMQQAYGENIAAPIWKELPHSNRRFLVAMSYDNGSSRVSDIIQRLKSNKNSINKVRSRLIREGLIRASRYGYVEFVDDQIRNAAVEHRYEFHLDEDADAPDVIPYDQDPTI